MARSSRLLTDYKAASLNLATRLALDRLPYQDRLLLHLYFVLDLPAVEVAQVLGISTGAVKSRIHRVTRRLRPGLNTVEVIP